MCSNVLIEWQHIQAVIVVQAKGSFLALAFKHELGRSSVDGNAELHAFQMQ